MHWAGRLWAPRLEGRDTLASPSILKGYNEAAVDHVRDERIRRRQGRWLPVDRPPPRQGSPEGTGFRSRPYRPLAPEQRPVGTPAVRLHVDLEATLREDRHHQGLPECTLVRPTDCR